MSTKRMFQILLFGHIWEITIWRQLSNFSFFFFSFMIFSSHLSSWTGKQSVILLRLLSLGMWCLIWKMNLALERDCSVPLLASMSGLYVERPFTKEDPGSGCCVNTKCLCHFGFHFSSLHCLGNSVQGNDAASLSDGPGLQSSQGTPRQARLLQRDRK